MPFWALLFGFMFSQNILVSQFLGISSLSRLSHYTLPKLLLNSLVFMVLFLFLVIFSLFWGFVLSLIHGESFHFYLVALSALGLSLVSGFFNKKEWAKGVLPQTQELLLNSAFFGGALVLVPVSGGIFNSLGAALGVGVGYALVRVLFWGILVRWTRETIPIYFRGWPLTLIAIGIIGLIFSGFQGFFTWGRGI